MKHGENGRFDKHISNGVNIIASKINNSEEGTKFYHSNHLGSTAVLTDNTGAKYQGYYYTPYGSEFVTENPGNNDIERKFTGQILDESGLYYFNNRYYDTDLGIFMRPDPALDGLNHYGYANCNPMRYVDPTGLLFNDWFFNNTGKTYPVYNSDVSYGDNDVFTGITSGNTRLEQITGTVDNILFSATNVISNGLVNTDKAMEEGAVAIGFTDSDYEAAKMYFMWINSTGELPAAMATLSPYLKAYAGNAINNLSKAFAGPTDDLAYGVCFTAGTLVLTEGNNLQAIETIKAGDLVYAGNPETGKVELKEVIEIFVREVSELYVLTITGENIETTAEHPFWIIGKGWTEAKNLQEGDIVLTASDSQETISNIEIRRLTIPVKVYNFQVEDFHTYYVGENSVLVHNTCASQGGIKYDPRIRVRAVQDPRGHNFPFSFDEVILNTKPTSIRGGAQGYALRGVNNGKDVIYNIIVKDGTIVHRDMISIKNWAQRSKSFGWPIELADIPSL